MKKKNKSTSETQQEQTTNQSSQVTSQQDIGVKECCKDQIELMSDKYLRLLAEFENFKKRTLKEKEELYKTSSSKIITAILPVMDDIDRALMTIPQTDENNPFFDGFDLIGKKFRTILMQQGLEQIVTLDQDFNTDYHEALTTLEVEESKKGKVIDEIEKGYLLNGHVIRFAKVVVGK